MRRNQFGSIRKLASGRFQVRITNAQGDRIAARSIDGKPLTFESEKTARTYLLHLQSDFMRGVDPYASNPRSSETLRDRLEKYLDGFGMRLPGLLIRIAQLFTLIENPQASAINDGCLKAALGLGDYLNNQRIAADVKADRTNEQRCLDKIAKMLNQFESVGDVGDVNRHFIFSTRDLQQQIKQQNWAKFGGVEAIEAALANLEKWLWIETDGDRWLVRPDLMKHRW